MGDIDDEVECLDDVFPRGALVHGVDGASRHLEKQYPIRVRPMREKHRSGGKLLGQRMD